MENQQQEALVVAEQLENGFITLGKTARELRYSAAATIRRQHARIQELEAMLDAVGAGAARAKQADALDADAFRVAVRLRLKTAFYDNAPPELHLPRQCAVAIKDGKFFATPYQGDDCAAMRAAIYAAAKENK